MQHLWRHTQSELKCVRSVCWGSSVDAALLPLPKVFRKDLISAMKLPDSHHVPPEDYYLLADTWRQEWEKGVQVLASPDTIPQPSAR